MTTSVEDRDMMAMATMLTMTVIAEVGTVWTRLRHVMVVMNVAMAIVDSQSLMISDDHAGVA